MNCTCSAVAYCEGLVPGLCSKGCVVCGCAGRDAVAAAGFEPPPHVAELRERVRAFMRKHVYPAEPKLEVPLAPVLLPPREDLLHLT